MKQSVDNIEYSNKGSCKGIWNWVFNFQITEEFHITLNGYKVQQQKKIGIDNDIQNMKNSWLTHKLIHLFKLKAKQDVGHLLYFNIQLSDLTQKK